MIAFVRGVFALKTPAQVIVDVNGVGYDLHISLHTFSAISNLEKGQLFTYLHITENGHTLYGFHELREKELFLQLISVSGVGASTARMMLSGMRPEEIVKAIVQGNAKQLEGIKGIGKKTAERLILELKDKLNKHTPDVAMLSPVDAQQYSMETDALNALVSLGIARPLAEQALKKALKSNHLTDDLTLEALIKMALKNI